MFDKYTDDQLFHAITDMSDSEIEPFLAGTPFDDVSDFKEHAFGEYYTRQLKAGRMLSAQHYQELAHEIKAGKWPWMGRCVIGDAITKDLVPHDLYESPEFRELLEGWSQKQAEARMILMRDDMEVTKAVDEFIRLNTQWAVYELLRSSDPERAKMIVDRIIDQKGFSRHDRHLFRETLNKIVTEGKR